MVPSRLALGEANAFLKTGVEDVRQAPDIDIIFMGGKGSPKHLKNFNMLPEEAKKTFGENATLELSDTGYNLLPTLLHPTSRGTIRLDKEFPPRSTTH